MSLVQREDSVESENISDLENIESNEKPKRSFWWVIKTTFIVIFVIWIISVVGSSFYSNAHTIMVDNPTWSWILVHIDDKDDINIPAFGSLEIDIDSWEHSLYLDGKKVWVFEKKFTDFDAFLNPTLDIYIAEYLLYSDDDKYFEKLPNNKIEAYGNEAEGPFKKYEWVYISWDWDYDLSEAFPDEVDMNRWQNYAIKQKIYRFDDFVDMYNENYVEEE